MKQIKPLDQLRRTITATVLQHPKDLTRHLMDTFKVSRQTATSHIKKLEEEGWVARSGPETRPVFSPGFRRQVAVGFQLKDLEEDRVWSESFRPYFNLPPNILAIAQHGFTEILNNAIDHSGGSRVFILATQNEDNFTLAISDNGIGIFEKITKALNLPDMRQALFELSKGKLTTDPSRHTGEGVFFTSRMFDSFVITANALEFTHNQKFARDLLCEAHDDLFPNGTLVWMKIALSSTRTPQQIFQEFTNAPEDFDFSRTVVPMRLAQFGDEQLISRSQAKRLIARFDRFKTVVLDFSGIQVIGQAFADELFRVYANAHPDVELVPNHMTQEVERMYQRAISPRM